MHVSESLPSKKSKRKSEKNLKAFLRKSQSSGNKLKAIENNALLEFNQPKLTKNVVTHSSTVLKLTHLAKTQHPKSDKKTRKMQIDYNVGNEEGWALLDLKQSKFIAG